MGVVDMVVDFVDIWDTENPFSLDKKRRGYY